MNRFSDFELALIREALGKDTRPEEVERAIKKGVTVYGSPAEYIEMLTDNGVLDGETVERVTAGEYSGDGVTPVWINEKCYIVAFTV